MSLVTVNDLRNNRDAITKVVQDLGLSKRRLAVLLRCETKVIRAWEQGLHKPDPIRAAVLCALDRARGKMTPERFASQLNNVLALHKAGVLEQLVEKGIVAALGDDAVQLAPGSAGAAAAEEAYREAKRRERSLRKRTRDFQRSVKGIVNRPMVEPPPPLSERAEILWAYLLEPGQDAAVETLAGLLERSA